LRARRANRSKDGVCRLDLRVPVRLSLRAAATAIALASYEDADTISVAGRERLLSWARRGVVTFGTDHVNMSDADGYEAEIEAAEQRLVELGLFPQDETDR
jgi:hypothetical protein